MKKPYQTIRQQGIANEQQLTAFLTKNGQGLLPMVELIEQSRECAKLWAGHADKT